MENKQIIEMLQLDMRGEHQAIIQYLLHAYAMPEGEVPCTVEEISRDEMRHLHWLADMILELGGDPGMDRLPIDTGPGTIAEQLQKDIALEQGAIALYRQHMEAIDHPKVRRLLGRIVQDELRHEEMFTALVEEAQAEGLAEIDATAAMGVVPSRAPQRVQDIVNTGIRHEYTVILQYLYHFFVSQDKELAETMKTSAINEMQHMGWLAEELTTRGGTLDMNYDEDKLVLTRDPEEMLRADIDAERDVTDVYTSQITEIQDEDLKGTLRYIRDHEIYHDAVFQEHLDEVRETKPGTSKSEEKTPPASPPRVIPSVGSLIDQDD